MRLFFTQTVACFFAATVCADIVSTRAIKVFNTSIPASKTSSVLEAQIESDPSKCLDNLYELCLKIDELAVDVQIEQLEYLLCIRKELDISEVHSLALSNLIGVLVSQKSLFLLRELEYTNTTFDGQWLDPRGFPKLRVKALADLLNKNAALAHSTRSGIVIICGLGEEPASAYCKVIENATSKSRDEYKEKWGVDVYVMKLSSGVPLPWQGLPNLIKSSSGSWDLVVNQPTVQESIIWWIATDIFMQRCSKLASSFAERISIEVENSVKDDIVINDYVDTLGELISVATAQKDIISPPTPRLLLE